MENKIYSAKEHVPACSTWPPAWLAPSRPVDAEMEPTETVAGSGTGDDQANEKPAHEIATIVPIESWDQTKADVALANFLMEAAHEESLPVMAKARRLGLFNTYREVVIGHHRDRDIAIYQDLEDFKNGPIRRWKTAARNVSRR
jgi:hypothetical protein